MISRFDMYGEWLRTDPIGFATYLFYFVAVVLLSLILHECAHGWVALKCGDNTAQMMGRLSLDPRRHLDPYGTLCMLVLGFGWARPVPVNPRNFRHYRRDDFLVSIAGITVNFTLFLLCSVLSVAVNRLMISGEVYDTFARMGAEGKEMLYAISNGVSIDRTYAATLTENSYMQALIQFYRLPEYVAEWYSLPGLLHLQRFLVLMRSINLSLAVFNLLPIPPLDGFRLVNNLLRGRFRLTQKVFKVTQIALVLLCLTGVLGQVLSVATGAIDDAVTRVLMLL